jgi:hypothetical protein
MPTGTESNSYVTAGQVAPVDGRPYPNTGEPMAPNRLIEENNIRTISIRQLNHGYIVEVGCQTLAIESSSKLIALFAEYVANPQATEYKYREGKLI